LFFLNRLAALQTFLLFPRRLLTVPFGSKADICTAKSDVRFTPNSDRKSGFPHVCFTPESGHVQCTSLCLLWANSGHSLP
jgi:hypothetical protein